jgi:YQGE family putative transporter
MTDQAHRHDRNPLISPADFTPSIGGIGAAWLKVFAPGLVTFAVGSVISTILFDAKGVLIFMAFLVLAKPVPDLAYFPIQMLILDKVLEIEPRNLYTYIFNHELGVVCRQVYWMRSVHFSQLRIARGRTEVCVANYRVLQMASIWVAPNTVSSVATVGIGPFRPVRVDSLFFTNS